ncbi:1-acyl-sn-glycerol-3-phosphate acyltransferase PLS1 [Acorus gramineus]|uniref:1-acyl-sn-glycerol-3-phosphate acyltransferase PLS1 n=1 Tax=Acorus gramineus TaxID=55184 RepID=A0AAV9A6F9_ACOGR|nr:1-acyl-sn-glycerol-3-phosphate acyltransferase PLS1 [Acorus gramineus]
MAIAAAAAVVPLGLLFLLSGLIVNLIQAICYIVIRPLSKSMYRRINRLVAELLWLELIWLIDWWAGVKVQVYADSETFHSMGKEHALVISNHRSDIDWLVGWVLAQRSGCLGSTLAVMKKSSKFLPFEIYARLYKNEGPCRLLVAENWTTLGSSDELLMGKECICLIVAGWEVIGWSMWFSEYLFLERNWAKDESTLKSGLLALKDYPQPFWLALFVEGTRFTKAKLLAAQEYASSQGLPVPRNVLIPRTKGFVSAVNHMRSFVPAIYDVTVDVAKDQPSPTMLRILKGQPSVDALLERHLIEGSFGSEEQPIGRSVKTLLVVASWSCLLMYATYKFFKWSSFLSTWKGIAFSVLCLLLVTAVMHIFIIFSQSERSTPAKVTPSRAKNEETTSDADHKKEK